MWSVSQVQPAFALLLPPCWPLSLQPSELSLLEGDPATLVPNCPTEFVGSSINRMASAFQGRDVESQVLELQSQSWVSLGVAQKAKSGEVPSKLEDQKEHFLDPLSNTHCLGSMTTVIDLQSSSTRVLSLMSP